MAAIGSTLLSSVFTKSEAEQILRPAREQIKDYMVYGIILLGVVLIPFTMLGSGTPINCQYCQGEDCTFMGAKYENNRTDPKHSAWWVKSYCTMNGHIMENDEGVKPFMLYFPYYLLFIGAALFAIEKIFHGSFGAKENMEKFYKLVIKSENRMQDVPRSKHEKLTVVTKVQKSDGTFSWANDWEMQKFFSKRRNSFAFSYFCCQFFGMSVALFLFLYMLLNDAFGFEHEDCAKNMSLKIKGCHFKTSTSFPCDVHGYYYECTGAPTHFFNTIKIIASVLSVVYIYCCWCGLNWLKPTWMQPCNPSKPFLRVLIDKLNETLPQGTLEEDLSECQKRTKQIIDQVNTLSTDARLFIDLLASTSGSDRAIRCLSCLDSNFKDSLYPEMLFPGQTEKKLKRSGNILEIRIQVGMSCLHKTLVNLSGRYRYGELRPVFVAELIPSKDFLGTEVQRFRSPEADEIPTCWEKFAYCMKNQDTTEDLEMGESDNEKPLIPTDTGSYCSSLSFEDIKDDVTYIVKLSTIVNGSIIKSKLFEVEDAE